MGRAAVLLKWTSIVVVLVFIARSQNRNQLVSTVLAPPAPSKTVPRRCREYTVCTCKSGAKEDNSVACVDGTCAWSPSAPTSCKDKYSPICETSQSWGTCQWANFNKVRKDSKINKKNYCELPGSSYVNMSLMSVPKIGTIDSSKGFQVFSDVDDTIMCSGGKIFAGVDTECKGTKRHDVYPGVVSFAMALSMGTSRTKRPSKMRLMSARPKELKMFLAMKKGSHMVKEFVRKESDWGIDLERSKYGSIMDSGNFFKFLQRGITHFNKVGYTKYTGWREAVEKREVSRPVIFLGDNGQGDLVGGQMMLKHSALLKDHQGATKVVFIHDVLKKADASCRAHWKEIGVVFFDDYAEAAEVASKMGLITVTDCNAIVEEVETKYVASGVKTIGMRKCQQQ